MIIKTENKIIIYSILAAVSFGFVDAVVETYIYGRGPFIYTLFFAADEVYVRLLGAVFFLVFGIIISRIFAAKSRIEKELLQSEARFRSLVESTDDSIYLVDRNCRYVYINRRHMLRLGLSEGNYKNKTFGDCHSPHETRIFTDIVNKVCERGESINNEYQSKRDGNHYLQTFSPITNGNGKVMAVTVISKEITARKMMEDRLRTLSLTDELTGLLNRRGFFVLAEQQLKLAGRKKKGMFLLAADLDNLKEINDTFGHKEGDLILLETSNILKKCYRESDIIARIGGDEFVILINESPETTFEALSGRLKTHLDAYNTQANKPYKLSLSTGITHYNPEQPCSVDELLSNADKLMYEMKRQYQRP